MKYMANPNLGIGSEYTHRLNAHASALHRLNQIEHRPELFVHRSMLGGGRFREDVLPGQNGAYPLDAARLEELKRMGGAKFSLGKTIRQVKEAIPASVRKKAYSAAKAAARPVVERYAARAGLEELVPVGERALDRAVGGINRYKKAKKWTDFAVSTVSKGLDLGAKGKSLFGYGELDGAGTRKDLPAGAAATKSHMKKLREGQGRAEIFVKGSDEAREHMAKLRAMPRKTRAPKEGGAAPKKARAPSARAAIVKQVMASEGLSMIAASKFVKANGLYTPK
jgi:hypothetical protein